MGEEVSQSQSERRSFLTGLTAGVSTVVATVAVAAATASTASGQSAPSQLWQPSRHELDDWLDKDKASVKHRFVFDTMNPEGFGQALLYSSNYFTANQSGYGLQNSDLAVVIVARHNSTPFAFNDDIWKKYGSTIAQQANFTDPKTKMPPTSNLYQATGYGSVLTSLGTTLDSVLKRGVQLAVCQMATRNYAGTIARAVGGATDAIYNEITANLVSNSHLVPAGIIAVNRAQERGYSFVHA
jgi:intracellular sulfur oxidation DsrE/DsrF family protein